MIKEILEQSKQINSDTVPEEKSINVVSICDPMLINKFSDVIGEIECSLSNLRALAIGTDFSKTTERQNYFNNITHLKRFYERGERILINGNCN